MLIVTVEDVDASVERLQAQGVQFLTDPRDFPGWGIRSAYLRDPDGNLIELYSDLPPHDARRSFTSQPASTEECNPTGCDGLRNRLLSLWPPCLRGGRANHQSMLPCASSLRS